MASLTQEQCEGKLNTLISQTIQSLKGGLYFINQRPTQDKEKILTIYNEAINALNLLINTQHEENKFIRAFTILDGLERKLSGFSKASTPNIPQILIKKQQIQGLFDECVEESRSLQEQINVVSSQNKTLPPSSESPSRESPPSDEKPLDIGICTKPSSDRWGVRFKYNVNPQGYNSSSSSTCSGDSGSNKPSSNKEQLPGVRHEWFLTLLPAMRSTLSSNGSVDTPGALPGLQFQIKSNVAKHKIPGFQPVFQHMGVDSIIITMVGTFTGDGGLGGIYTLEPKKDDEDRVIEGEFVDGENQANVTYTPWAALRKGHELTTKDINPLWNKTIPTHNRALRPTQSYDKETGLTRAEWNPYNSPDEGWRGNVKNNQFIPSEEVPWETPDLYMTKNLLRAGMFDRDGCPGECPPPGLSDGGYDKSTGRIEINQEQKMIGVDRDVASAYTLRELAAYLDSYHEFTSFYKIAMQEAREMEIEINLRRNNDGLVPQANKFLKYARDALGVLRSDNGNPSFKGIVKDMRVYHARSDRTWYMMDIEITDYGMASNTPINLTNDLEASTKKALQELIVQRQKDDSIKSTTNLTDECGEEIVQKGDLIKIKLKEKPIGAKYSYFVIDKNTGYSTFATEDKEGNLSYNSSNGKGSIVDPKQTLIYLLTTIKGDYSLVDTIKHFDYKPITDISPDYYNNKTKDSLTNLERVYSGYLLASGEDLYVDKDTGYGLQFKRVLLNKTESVIPPNTLIKEYLLRPLNVRLDKDVLTVINNPNVQVYIKNSHTYDACGDNLSIVSNTSSPTEESNAPPSGQSGSTRSQSKGNLDQCLASFIAGKLISLPRKDGSIEQYDPYTGYMGIQNEGDKINKIDINVKNNMIRIINNSIESLYDISIYQLRIKLSSLLLDNLVVRYIREPSYYKNSNNINFSLIDNNVVLFRENIYLDKDTGFGIEIKDNSVVKVYSPIEFIPLLINPLNLQVLKELLNSSNITISGTKTYSECE